MLGVHEAAAYTPSDPGLAQLAELRVEQALRAAVEGDARDSVVEHIGNEGERGPPVARGARGGAGLVDRIPIPEQHLEDRLGAGVEVGPTYPSEAWHARTVGPAVSPTPAGRPAPVS